MNGFAHMVQLTKVETGYLAIFWLGQAGFVYKTPAGRIIYIDPYLSDCAHRILAHERYGFKRLMPTMIEPEEVRADWVACTHAHLDHFDVDAIPVLAQQPGLRFIAAPDCQAEFEKLRVPAVRYTILHAGQTLDCEDIKLTGIPADHGDLAPEALGFLLQVGQIRVWQVGDSALCLARWQALCQAGVDVLIPPINGAYGNLDAVQAAQLAGAVKARIVIPCHFWMFAEHNGNPAAFLEACKTYAPETRPVLLSPGEPFLIHEM